MRLTNIFSKKNINLVVGLLALMIFLWLVSYAIPSLFIQMFGTSLGKLILLGISVLAGIYNIKLGVGLLVMFYILYRFAYMARENMSAGEYTARLRDRTIRKNEMLQARRAKELKAKKLMFSK